VRTRRSFPNCRLYREDSQASDDVGGMALRIPDVANVDISAGIAGVLLKSSDGDDGQVRIGWMLREVNPQPAFCLSKFQ